MHARLHEGPHCCLVTPHGAGPEGAIGVAEDGDGDVASRVLRLTSDANRLDQELRQEAPTPNPEAGDGDEGHQLRTSFWPDQPLTPYLLVRAASSRHDRLGANNAQNTGGNRPRYRRHYCARTLGRECGGKTPREGKKPARPEAFLSVTPPAPHLKAANGALARLELDIKTVSGYPVRRTA